MADDDHVGHFGQVAPYLYRGGRVGVKELKAGAMQSDSIGKCALQHQVASMGRVSVKATAASLAFLY